MSKQEFNVEFLPLGGKTIEFITPPILEDEEMQKVKAAKEELLRRYVYLHENREVILAPYLDTTVYCEKEHPGITYNLGINYERFDELTSMIEEFLLSEKPFEESKFYEYIEAKKLEPEFMGIVNQKLEEANNNRQIIYLSMDKIFENLSIYFLKREKKYHPTWDSILVGDVLDQYYKLLNFEIHKIGRYVRGMKEYIDDEFIKKHFKFIKPKKASGPGTTKENSFIKVISDASTHLSTCPTYSIFTFEELIEIALKYPKHDRNSVPIVCDKCGKEMNLVPYSEGIFIFTDPVTNNKYQICPHCKMPRVLSEEELRNLSAKYPPKQTVKPKQRGRRKPKPQQ